MSRTFKLRIHGSSLWSYIVIGKTPEKCDLFISLLQRGGRSE